MALSLKDMTEADEDYISKSQIKRECHALTDLGVELVDLSTDQLKGLPLSDTLLKAIEEAKHISKHSAIKRQRLYIGKLIRNEDWEAISEAYGKIKEKRETQNAEFKALEKWRDRMLSEGDTVVNAFIAEHHDADRQKLRQLVKNAVNDRKLNKPPVNARKLFKYIREIIENSTDSL